LRLTAEEETAVDKELDRLITDNLCFKSNNGFYSLQAKVEELERLRLEKEKRAQKYFKKLPFYSKLISRFPFVKGIAISGSLSKNVMHDDGDIDYFIITSKGRLWICRTLLILFKKIFLLNSRKYFCVNYFVDEENISIKDKNIFTAIEVAFLLPVYNAAVFKNFREVNSWTQEFIPSTQECIKFDVFEGDSLGKKWIESPLKAKWADRLDLFLMRLTHKGGRRNSKISLRRNLS
jgi:hypothetical protein